jgi:hypothetical protein
MADLTWFNPAEVPEDTFEPLPAGEYKVIITESTDTPTKKGDGKYFNLKLEVIDGQYKGRVLFDKLNYHNPNETARKMAQQSLKAICEAVGLAKASDTMQFHNIPIIVKLSVTAGKGEYGPSNNVKGYKRIGGVSQPATAQKAIQQVTQPVAAESAPWS